MDWHLPVDMTNRTYNELTIEEKLRFDHQLLHEKHKGHETMHSVIVLIWILVMVGSQFALFYWKKHYQRSYAAVTLATFWLVPFAISVAYRFWLFCFVWLAFTAITCRIGQNALRKPIESTVPRLVYKWFYFIYLASYAAGIFGYCLIFLVMFRVPAVFGLDLNAWSELAVLCIYYGLYFGVLGRDISEVCTDKMTTYIGYYNARGMPLRTLEPNICAVCGNGTKNVDGGDGRDGSDSKGAIEEETFRLSCEHVVHEFCLRGWIIVGKKHVCPYCKEKVDAALLFSQPWQKPHLLYGNLLDILHYLLSWQPLIIFLIYAIQYVFDLQ